MFQGHELNHLNLVDFFCTEKSEKVDDSQPSLAYRLCREPQMLRAKANYLWKSKPPRSPQMVVLSKVFRPNFFRNSGCPDGFIAYSMIGSFGSHILSNTWQDPVDIRHPPVISGEGQ